MSIETAFDVEQAEVISRGDSMANALKEGYLGKFEQFMPALFNQDFLDEMEEAVDDSQKITSDEFFVKKQAKETLDVELVRKEANFEVRLLRVYASKVYTDNPGVFNTFNFTGHQKVRNSNDKMFLYFKNLVRVVEENIVDLTAGGFPTTKLDELKQLVGRFDRERDEQQSVMRERYKLTDYRVKVMNYLWGLMKELSDVREFALPGDPVGQAIFALPQPKSSTGPSDELDG